MASSPSVVIVGSGIVGASIAWYLSAAGAQVTVIDAGAAGGVATPASFAWINASWGNPEPYFRLRMRAIAEWRSLGEALPSLPISWCRGLCFDLPPDELRAFAREYAGWGYGIREVDETEIRRIEPHLAKPPPFALHMADEAAVEPQAAALQLLDGVRSRGGRIIENVPVTSFVKRAGTIVGVNTSAGSIAADEVVVAAGAGAASLLAAAGLVLEMSAPGGMLVHSKPHRRLLNGLVLTPEMHMRQTLDGRLLAGADFGGTEPGEDAAATAEAQFARMRSMLRGAEDLSFDRATVGYRPTPAGGFPAIGRPAGMPGLFIAVMHSGVTLAPAVGRFVQEELMSGERQPLLMPYRAEAKVAFG